MHVDRFPQDLREAYAPLRRIGAGGMGVVFQAKEVALNRPVAVKLLLPGGTEQYDEEARFRFLEEARVMARVVHENVIEIYSVGTCEAGPYLVMEYIEGEALHEVQRPLDLLDLFLALADGLDAVHAEGVLHRDIKPPNILVRSDDRPVLLDFGLARDSGRATFTGTGQVMGTNGFLAPELLMGRPATRASDWFAWGVSLYVIAEGCLPYAPADILELIQGRPLAPAPFCKTPVGHPLRVLLESGLSPDPSERPSDAAAVRAALQDPSSSMSRDMFTRLPAQSIDGATLREFTGEASPSASGVGETSAGSMRDSGVFASAAVPAAASSWWLRSRGRRRFFRLYLPVALAWLAAGALAWGAWVFLRRPPAPDVKAEIRARLAKDRLRDQERYASELAASFAGLRGAREELREVEPGPRDPSHHSFTGLEVPKWYQAEHRYLESGLKLLREILQAKKTGVLGPGTSAPGLTPGLRDLVRELARRMAKTEDTIERRRDAEKSIQLLALLSERDFASHRIYRPLVQRNRRLEEAVSTYWHLVDKMRPGLESTPLTNEVYAVLIGSEEAAAQP